MEYRIQARGSNGEWFFITDRRGKFYTYFDEKTARKYGPHHARCRRNPLTNEWERNVDDFRIVKADIDWQPVSL